VESGIIAGWVRLCRQEHPLEYVPFTPELVGQKPVNIVLGKNSGPPSIDEWARRPASRSPTRSAWRCCWR
jgi:hypothetical protein